MQYQPHLSHPHFCPAPTKQSSSPQNIAIAFLLIVVVGMVGVLLILRSFQAPAPLSATLVISAGQAAVVSINEEPIGVAEAGLPLVREVYSGKYTVRVKGKADSAAVVREVEVKGGEVKTLHFGPKRDVVPSQTGANTGS